MFQKLSVSCLIFCCTTVFFLPSCTPMYGAAAQTALMRGSLEEAEKFLVLGDFSEEERNRILIAWCQKQNRLARDNNEVARNNLVTCFQSGPSEFAENLELAEQELASGA